MKKKRILLTVVGLAVSIVSIAQQLDRYVIASAGGSDASGSYTIGEVMVSSANLAVIAGFQQPSFMLDLPLGITDITGKLNVFPIPTKSILTINGEYFDGIATQANLFSLDGRRMEATTQRYPNEMNLDLRNLQAGYYYLTLINELTNTIAKYKILKY
jgi:type IX secretion system substrate protein